MNQEYLTEERWSHAGLRIQSCKKMWVAFVEERKNERNEEGTVSEMKSARRENGKGKEQQINFCSPQSSLHELGNGNGNNE